MVVGVGAPCAKLFGECLRFWQVEVADGDEVDIAELQGRIDVPKGVGAAADEAGPDFGGVDKLARKADFLSMVTLLAGFQNGKVSLSVGGVEDDGHYRLPSPRLTAP